ncbi:MULTISPECIES: hypothetical protein [Enterobacteriaceae]|jgi:hypothetical protein|uniref:hypothetical protein n=1 Tax=Enterobacteriaceae TaxID=543 RepID=UPI001CC179BA|nr:MULTISPECIES: hypothetical protein [Enterobacteriaceae]MCP5954727.1 hypothetical protein [Klebsiella pneumoniae]MDD1873573.1 hypothetical protein [Klebsiella pneumoniae]MDM9239728.1 hypothetical protein [Klebsiella pneumoniae]MEB6127899.1 hypothetical protein [Klebsiella pneumoniae]
MEELKENDITDAELDSFAFKFFKLFAQYEYFLKKENFFQTIRNKIIVDWDSYANKVVGKNFMDLLGESSASADYILKNPPKAQVVVNGVIVWKDVNNNEINVQALFGHIGRVRNNLFHGGKFNGTWFDPARSALLLRHSLIILECLRDKGMIRIEK